MIEIDGFAFTQTTPLGTGHDTGAGILRAPDGSAAGLHWEVADSAYIARVEGPGGDHWGVYRVGFTAPPIDDDALRGLLQPLMGRLGILWKRARGVS